MRPAPRLLPCLLLSLAGAFAGGLVAADEPPAPRLEVVPVIDLGEVIRGRTEPVVFELRNAGDATLHILEAKPG